MKAYVWLSFAFMGWAYYEVSGGADFEPEQREVAIAEAEAAPAPVEVTRAATPTLLAISASNRAPEPAADESIVPVTTQVAAVDPSPQLEDPIEIVAPGVEPKLDLREVAGSRVNMRMGPGTNYDVITTLNGGTELEVLSINSDGWANVKTTDRGIEGWMAERLLTDAPL